MKMMRNLVYMVLISFSVLCLSGCNNGADKLRVAHSIVFERPDSAYSILRDIDYDDLDADSLKAKYILTKAIANIRMGRSLITDTLLSQAASFYISEGDTSNWVIATQLLSGFYFMKGDPDKAIRRLEEMLPKIKNPELLWDNYNHLLELTINNQDYEKAYGYADWLQRHTNLPEDILKFGTAKGAAKYMQGDFSDALDILDSVIATGATRKARPEASAEFFEEYAEILDGAGQSHRAISIVDSVYQSMPHPDNGPDRILRIGATAQFYANTGDMAKAKALLDSINHDNTQNIFEIYTYIAILRAGIQYKETGRFPTNMMHWVTKNIDRNFQLAQFDRQTALESIIELNDDNYELKLQRQRLWLLIAGISIVLIISGICVYFVLNRRKQRLIETEERAETLELMLKDMEKAESGQADTSNGDKLKAALLRQLGIFKTFASTPTQQSRDALKKISTVGNDGESIESLVDWKDFYSMIDNLYDGFHSKLCKKYPGTFNDKEQQIIVLLKAGFSTKEIGVLSEQSSATIYTRKSVIRKKLGTSENKDFIAQLEEDFKAD